jgi:hypothetical protein
MRDSDTVATATLMSMPTLVFQILRKLSERGSRPVTRFQKVKEFQIVRKAASLIALGGAHFLLFAKSNGINSPPLSTKETLGLTCTT